jgi:hypothetical protein
MGMYRTDYSTVKAGVRLAARLSKTPLGHSYRITRRMRGEDYDTKRILEAYAHEHGPG